MTIYIAGKPHNDMSVSEESGSIKQRARYASVFGHRTRFAVLILMMFCLTIVWSNILTFNFAIVCIDDEWDESNHTSTQPFSSGQRTYAVSIVAALALICNFPVMQLANRFGIRLVFTLLGLLSAFATLMIPLSIQWGYGYFMVMRALQGVAFAINFPAIGVFCSRWSYFKQNGLFVSFLVAYVQLAPTITDPLSGALCTAASWQSIFYVHGSIAVVLFLIYPIFFRNNPAKHPFVSTVELGKIALGKHATNAHRTPYKLILKTASIWAVWIAGFGNFMCVNLLFLYSPTYLSAVLGFPIHQTGLTAALAPSLQYLMKLICGTISDRIHCLSETNKFRAFNSFAYFGATALFCVLAFLGSEHKNTNMIILSVIGGIMGSTTGGFYKAGYVLSKQFSPFVMGNISLCMNFTMIILPFIMHWLAPNNTADEWKAVFLVVAGCLLVTNIVFCIFVEGDACWWTVPAKLPQLTISSITNEKLEHYCRDGPCSSISFTDEGTTSSNAERHHT